MRGACIRLSRMGILSGYHTIIPRCFSTPYKPRLDCGGLAPEHRASSDSTPRGHVTLRHHPPHLTLNAFDCHFESDSH